MSELLKNIPLSLLRPRSFDRMRYGLHPNKHTFGLQRIPRVEGTRPRLLKFHALTQRLAGASFGRTSASAGFFQDLTTSKVFRADEIR